MSKILRVIIKAIKAHPLLQSFLMCSIYYFIALVGMSSDVFAPLFELISPFIMYCIMLLGLVRECAIVHTYSAHKYFKYMIYCAYVLNIIIIIIAIFNFLTDTFNII